MDSEVDSGPHPSALAAATPAGGLPAARGFHGERATARVLRAGAFLAGLCFTASIVLEWLPAAATLAHDAEVLRAAGATLLVVTPVARLVVAGVSLGRRGEYRYSTLAAIILALMIAAAGLGFVS